MIQQKSLFRKNRVLVYQYVIIIKSNYCERIYVLLKKNQSNPYYPLEECTFISKQLLPPICIQWRRKVIMLQKIYISWVIVDVDRFGGLRHRPTDLFFFVLFFLILGYFFYITSYNGIVFFIQKYSLYIIVFKNLYIHNDTLCYNIEYAFCLIEDSHIHCSQDPNGHILTVLFFFIL